MQPIMVVETNSTYVANRIKYGLRDYYIRCFVRRIELDEMQNDKYSHYRYRRLYVDLAKKLNDYKLKGVYVYKKSYDDALSTSMREANILNVYHGYRTHIDNGRVIIIDANDFIRDLIRIHISERAFIDISTELTNNSMYRKFECKNSAVETQPSACMVFSQVQDEAIRAAICRLIGCPHLRIEATDSSNCIRRRVEVF